METKTEDRRIRKTKKAIHEALYTLMQEKPAAEISIIELTTTADINRKTFYNHYSDIHDVLNEMEDELVDHVLDVISKQFQRRNTVLFQNVTQIEKHIDLIAFPFFQAMLRQLTEIKEHFLILCNYGSYNHIRDKLVAKATQLLVNFYDYSYADQKWVQYYLLFVIDGASAVFFEWARSDDPTPEADLARFFSKIFTSGILGEFVKGN